MRHPSFILHVFVRGACAEWLLCIDGCRTKEEAEVRAGELEEKAEEYDTLAEELEMVKMELENKEMELVEAQLGGDGGEKDEEDETPAAEEPAEEEEVEEEVKAVSTPLARQASSADVGSMDAAESLKEGKVMWMDAKNGEKERVLYITVRTSSLHAPLSWLASEKVRFACCRRRICGCSRRGRPRRPARSGGPSRSPQTWRVSHPMRTSKYKMDLPKRACTRSGRMRRSRRATRGPAHLRRRRSRGRRRFRMRSMCWAERER